MGDPVLTLEAQLQSEDEEFNHIKPPEKQVCLMNILEFVTTRGCFVWRADIR
jgi:hypothetical protein